MKFLSKLSPSVLATAVVVGVLIIVILFIANPMPMFGLTLIGVGLLCMFLAWRLIRDLIAESREG